MDELQKTVLVTGAGQGIGKSIALALAAQNFFVAINDLSIESVEAVCDEIVSTGGSAISCVGDISSPQAVEIIFTTIKKAWGNKLTGLVNNAGIIRTQSLAETTPADWDLVMAVNLRSVFLTCKAAFPIMQKAGYGKIVNISSAAALLGGGLLGNSCYAAAKGAVISFTKGVAREGGPFGIRANALIPALTDTVMTAVLDEEKRQNIISQIPLKRAGTPEDLAKATVFLLSESSDYISGTVLTVDGGFTRHG